MTRSSGLIRGRSSLSRDLGLLIPSVPEVTVLDAPMYAGKETNLAPSAGTIQFVNGNICGRRDGGAGAGASADREREPRHMVSFRQSCMTPPARDWYRRSYAR
jgi:hypothetical protein